MLHEIRSGYAGTHMVVWGPDQKCHQWGAQRVYGAGVTGYTLDASGSVTAGETAHPFGGQKRGVGRGVRRPVG